MANVYQCPEGELKKVSRRGDKASGPSYLSFHSVRMYTDAAKLKLFRETGTFPQLSKSARVVKQNMIPGKELPGGLYVTVHLFMPFKLIVQEEPHGVET